MMSNPSNALNPQEQLLMQMLKQTLPKTSTSTSTSTSTPSPAPVAASTFHLQTQVKIKYEPSFLLSLQNSPLVPPRSFWDSELPPVEFFRLKQQQLRPNNIQENNRKERRKSNNNSSRRTGSFKREKEDLLNDSKEDRKSQRIRQKENKRRGKEFNNNNSSAIIEEDDSDNPSWMKEQDMPTGNSILDFELWRLKMRIETAKRNGEEVSSDDLLEYEKLKNQANNEPNKQKESEVNNNILKPQSPLIKEQIINEEPTIQKNNEKAFRSVDDQFDLPLSNNFKPTPTKSSNFSSFFDSPPSDAVNDKRSSRLLPILDQPPTPNSQSTTPIPQQQPLIQPILQSQQQLPRLQQQPLNIDKNQLFFQSLMSKAQPQMPFVDPNMMQKQPQIQFYSPAMQAQFQQQQHQQPHPQQQHQQQHQQQQHQQQQHQQQQHQHQQQQAQQQPQVSQRPNSLPYTNQPNMQGMAPNHPLMMLLNKNKRKSSDIKSQSPTTPSNQMNYSPSIHAMSDIQGMQPPMNNMNGMPINGMPMNGIPMNPMNNMPMRNMPINNIPMNGMPMNYNRSQSPY
jgi:hypothetical protein